MRLAYACVGWVVVLFAGCGQGPPPLDELPLRDSLRADPEVVAALSDDARARLAARLDTASARDTVTDDVADAGEDPATLVAAVDRARAERHAEPLIVGEISAGIARPLPDRADGCESDARPLPSLEDAAGTATTDAELAALAGDAGTTVRGLLKASGASRLRRVTGWATGATAVGDVVYVNAAWLVALAPGGSGRPDGGASAAPASSGSATVAPSRAAGLDRATVEAPREEQSASASGPEEFYDPDGGTPPAPPPPPPPPPEDDTSFWDACSACSDACASSPSCDSSSSDSCDDSGGDGSSDSCSSGPDDGSSDSCSGTDDGASGCQVAKAARPRCRGRGSRSSRGATEAWLLTPLGFLMASQRKRGP